jgi:hypothetical protein
MQPANTPSKTPLRRHSDFGLQQRQQSRWQHRFTCLSDSGRASRGGRPLRLTMESTGAAQPIPTFSLRELAPRHLPHLTRATLCGSRSPFRPHGIGTSSSQKSRSGERNPAIGFDDQPTLMSLIGPSPRQCCMGLTGVSFYIAFLPFDLFSEPWQCIAKSRGVRFRPTTTRVRFVSLDIPSPVACFYLFLPQVGTDVDIVVPG